MRVRRVLSSLLAPSLAFALAACGGDEEGEDAGAQDATVQDGGVVADGGPGDSGITADSGAEDGGTPDTGVEQDAGPPPDSGGPRSIVFFHTNDEHSQHLGFEPTVDDFPTPSNDEATRGGILRRAKVLDDLRVEAGRSPYLSPTVTVSAGDTMMGTLFQLGNLFSGTDYALQGALRYDVTTLGNHEFDFGAATLAGAIRQGHLDPLTQQFSTLRIPTVVSNIRFSMSSPGDDALAAFYAAEGGQDRPIRRYHIQRFRDVTVGFVGYVGLDAALVAPFKSPVNFSLAIDPTSPCENDGQCPGSVCIPPAEDPTATSGHCAVESTGADFATHMPALIEDVASAVAEVRSRGVDLVVAVSHAGLNERELATLQAMGLPASDAVVSEDIAVAKGVDQLLAAKSIPGIDLIIGGHSHTPLEAPIVIPNRNSGIATHIVQAGSYGEHVGKLRLTQQSGDHPWVLDAEYSGLVPVDGRVDVTDLSIITRMVIDGVLGLLMDGLETQGIATAGDNLIFPGEQCDGTAFPNNGQCAGLVPGAVGGTLACHPNRQLDFSGCTLAPLATCGDGEVGGAEQCDGAVVPATCQAMGYTGGTLSCAANCTLNFSACTPHFPSLLEIVANFGRPEGEPNIRGRPAGRGSLFFYDLGTTSFDVGGKRTSNESNLSNLVADSARWTANTLVPRLQQNPIQVAITANGVIRSGVYEGNTGRLTLADLFRVLPLGVSPVENTPGFSMTDFWVNAQELKLALEVGLSRGMEGDSFWLGISGAQVEYDLSRPPLDRVTRIHLIQPTKGDNPWDDEGATFEPTALYDASAGGFGGNAGRLIHVSSDVYITLFATGFGICPRDAQGAPMPHCRPCTEDSQCVVPGASCNVQAGVCSGGAPVAFSVRTMVPATAGLSQELKAFLALTTYVRNLPDAALPSQYNGSVPRRHCCVGSACPADGTRTCPPR